MVLYIQEGPVQLPFAWDEAKRVLTIARRGVDFLDAAAIFDGLTLVRSDDRIDYGEQRMLAVGRVGERHFTVVFTDRTYQGLSGKMVRRIISARHSNRQERREYARAFGGVPPR